MDNYIGYTKLVAIVDKEMATECLKAVGIGDDILALHPCCNDGKPFVAHLIYWGDGYVRLDFAYKYSAGLFPIKEGELVEQICFQAFLDILRTIDRTKIILKHG